jgi:hypothetical protein
MTPQEAEALIRQGEAIDQGAKAATDEALGIVPEPIPTDDDKAKEWLFAPELLGLVIGLILPETSDFYDDEQMQKKVAAKIVPVAEKYGWNGASSSPEIGLGLAIIGFAMPAVMAYQTRKANAERVIQNSPMVPKDGS